MSSAARTTRFRFWLWLIRLVGIIVPRRLRDDWRQEWEAELVHREEMLREWDRLDWRNKLYVLWRSTSAFWDAIWMQTHRWEDAFFQDLRYGARMLLKYKGFTSVAMLTLALGIAANTAVFSIVNAVILRPLPYHKPERIVAIWDGSGQPSSGQGTTLPRYFQLWRDRSNSLSHLALARNFSYRLQDTNEAASGVGMEVTPELFDLLGIPALHGSSLLPGDEVAALRAVLLSHELWQRNFAGDESIVGRTIKLNDRPATVVGIMPPEFVFPPRVELAPDTVARSCDLWVPMAIDQQRLQTSGKSYLAFGRLNQGVTLQQAHAEMNTLEPMLTEADPSLNEHLSVHVALLQELSIREVRPILSVLMGVAAFILLIASANVANLLLARTGARAREFAVRSALGATRSRVIRQIAVECALLGFIGGFAGLAFASWGLKLLGIVAVIQSPQPVQIDTTVIAFTLILSLFASVIFGIGAAWQMTRTQIHSSLQEAGRTGAGGVRLGRVRNGLVVAQVAVSLVLSVSTGLLTRTLWKLLQVDPGFRAEQVLAVDIRLPSSKYPRAKSVAAFTEILERVSRLPGVVSTGATALLPIRSDPYTESFQIKGRAARSATDLLTAEYRLVTPGYFSTMQIPLVEGRYLSDTDSEKTGGVVVITERLARLYFSGESSIGQRLGLSDSPNDPGMEIVGVVRDIRNWGLAADPTPEIYGTYRQNPKLLMTLVVRSAGDPMQLVSLVRSELRAFDTELVAERIGTMDEILSRSLSQRRLNLLLVGALAALALGLTVFGLYSLISYTAARRTHEIGIRVALGAQRRDILRLILSQGITLTILGIGMGLAGALVATRALQSLLFGIKPTDPITLIATTLLLGAITLLASYFPAWRATKVDPVIALRHE